jgi:hypothetical protein
MIGLRLKKVVEAGESLKLNGGKVPALGTLWFNYGKHPII